MEFGDKITIAILIIIALGWGWWGFAMLDVSAQCLEHGYPQGRLSWKFDAYCVKRVDQTDTVTPLREAVK